MFSCSRVWEHEKDILWELQKGSEPHQNICRMAWVCQQTRTIALKPLWLPDSCTLRQWLELEDQVQGHQVPTPQDRLCIMERVADALVFLHKRGISHNQICSSNILLGKDVTQDVLLVDFSGADRFSKQQSPGSGGEVGSVVRRSFGIPNTTVCPTDALTPCKAVMGVAVNVEVARRRSRISAQHQLPLLLPVVAA